jgi:hypothetical protein
MASFYCGTVQEFLRESDGEILASLQVGYATRGYVRQYTDQTLAWERDIRTLRHTLNLCVAKSESAGSWGLVLEFSIPRKELRIDIALLVRDVVVVLETKSAVGATAKQQIEEYSLLLHYFHKASASREIVPILLSSETVAANDNTPSQRDLYPQMPGYWISPVGRSSWEDLDNRLIAIERGRSSQILVSDWNDSPYFPVPSVIEAAMALKSGLSIREIAHSEASEHEIEAICRTVQGFVDQAKTERHHAICFVTGVPGSGKTLVGLSLAHAEENKASAIHFMSGNGPLVKVLQYLFTQESMKKGQTATQARTEAKTLIENVHVFARYHTEDYAGPPSNHAIIFDEAQRAWDRAQNLKKFKRDYSEPEMLLRIMERHQDWAVVIALVGGGQEINDGEAGLEEWGRALAGSDKNWIVYASPEVLDGGPSTAGHRLFGNSEKHQEVRTHSQLHLRTSNRSIRSEHLAIWVNHVLEGDSGKAASLRVTGKFPIFLSRDLKETRFKLRQQGIGLNRYGLIGSSGAVRLRAEGLEPSSSFHADYPWHHWYLAGSEDLRSSCQCEVFATEFEIQGLELDWIGLCWGGDFIWDELAGWRLRALHHAKRSKWIEIKNFDQQTYRRNAYRVLLTRARQGMFIFVPRGNSEDPTASPEEFEATAQFLVLCGAIPTSAAEYKHEQS